MKVIFNESGEIRDVANGYARNYLFPNNIAVAATPEAIKASESVRAAHQAELTAKQGEWDALRDQLAAVTLEITSAANQDGTLFAAVSAQDVVTAAAHHQFTLQPEWIVIGDPIKHIGEQVVTVTFPHGTKSTLKINVVAAS
jgi:large subunit ribosomal protein L9